MSTNKKSIYQKLNEARTKFHSMELKKTGYNKFASYYYFELRDFLIPALKIFEEVGLCAVITFSSETAAMTIHEVDGDGKIAITSPMADAPGHVNCTIPRPCRGGAKVLGPGRL